MADSGRRWREGDTRSRPPTQRQDQEADYQRLRRIRYSNAFPYALQAQAMNGTLDNDYLNRLLQHVGSNSSLIVDEATHEILTGMEIGQKRNLVEISDPNFNTLLENAYQGYRERQSEIASQIKNECTRLLIYRGVSVAASRFYNALNALGYDTSQYRLNISHPVTLVDAIQGITNLDYGLNILEDRYMTTASRLLRDYINDYLN